MYVCMRLKAMASGALVEIDAVSPYTCMNPLLTYDRELAR